MKQARCYARSRKRGDAVEQPVRSNDDGAAHQFGLGAPSVVIDITLGSWLNGYPATSGLAGRVMSQGGKMQSVIFLCRRTRWSLVPVALIYSTVILASSAGAKGTEADVSPCRDGGLSGGAGSRALVTGFAGQRRYLLPKHPERCTGNQAGGCGATSYLVTGDEVKLGTDCDGYVFVEFAGKKRISSGWIPNGSVKSVALGSSSTEGIPMSGVVDPICGFVQQRLNSALNSNSHEPAFKSPLKNIQSTEKLPNNAENGDRVWDVHTADADIGAHHVKVLSYSAGGTCSNSVLELWNKDFSKRIPVEGASGSAIDEKYSDDFGGYTSEDLIQWESKTYFLQYSRAQRHVLVFGIQNDLSSKFVCELTQKPLKHEVIKVSNDAAVCNAAIKGDVEDLALGSDPHMGPEIKGDIVAAEVGPYVQGAGQVALSGRAPIDVQNQGRPESISMASIYNASGAGCGHDFFTQWPVILNSDGKPDSRNPFSQVAFEHSGPDDDSRLFRYRGSVYLERRSLDLSDERAHEIWKFTGATPNLVCSLATVHYVIDRTQ